MVISICENDFPCLNVKFVLFSCECGAFSWEEGDLYVEMHLIFKCTFDCEVAITSVVKFTRRSFENNAKKY